MNFGIDPGGTTGFAWGNSSLLGCAQIGFLGGDMSRVGICVPGSDSFSFSVGDSITVFVRNRYSSGRSGRVVFEPKGINTVASDAYSWEKACQNIALATFSFMVSLGLGSGLGSFVGIEDFVLRGAGSGGRSSGTAGRDGLAPVRVCTALYSVVAASSLGSSVGWRFNSASAAKGRWTDQRLRDRGWYQAGMPHAMDAVRHYGLTTLIPEGKKG